MEENEKKGSPILGTAGAMRPSEALQHVLEMTPDERNKHLECFASDGAKLLQGLSYTQIKTTPTANIQHPCHAWALSAGYESWGAALAEMRSGKVLCGQLNTVTARSVSMLGMELFIELVTNENLHIAFTEVGGCLLGERDRFPAELLEEQDAHAKRIKHKLESQGILK
jgi:hypothetical protein